MTVAEVENVRLFFIIGRPRSGTTLLRTLLDAHPNVIVPTEYPFILNLYKRYRNINKPDKKTIDNIVTDLQKIWAFKITNIDAELLRKNLYEYEGNINYLTLCKIIILHYPAVFPKEKIILVGDKNPAYAFKFKRLYTIFKNECKYIQIIRDPRDQIISLRNLKMELPFTATSAKNWTYADIAFNIIANKNKKNFMTVKYEDLVTEPEKRLKEVNDFLDIPFNCDVLKFHEKKEEFKKQFSEELLKNVHKSLLNPIKPDKIGLWKNKLTTKEKEIIEIITEKQLHLHGYEIIKIRKPAIIFIQALPGILVHYLSVILVKISYLLPFDIFVKLSRRSFLGYIWFKYIVRDNLAISKRLKN